jgi:hypothetical protein
MDLSYLNEYRGASSELLHKMAKQIIKKPEGELNEFDMPNINMPTEFEPSEEDIAKVRESVSTIITFIMSCKRGNELAFKFKANNLDYEFIATLKGFANVNHIANKQIITR